MILLVAGEILALLLSLFFAAMSVMMFDAPGSGDRSDLVLAFWSIAAVPLAFLIGTGFALAGAIRYTRRRLQCALLIPALAFGWAVVAMAMIGPS